MAWINDDNIENLIKRMLKEFGLGLPMNFQPPQGDEGRSWVYGYSMTMGPDGRPIIKEFGNIPPRQPDNILDFQETYPQSENREPLVQTDIDTEENKVRILVELPGVTKESIKINATEKHIRLHASHETRSYDTEIPLMGRVDPKSAKATYNNGILDLTFDLIEHPEETGVNIQVE